MSLLVGDWSAIPRPAAADPIAAGTGEREAESPENVLAGGALAWSCGRCSGGAKVGNIGFAGQLVIAGIDAPFDATYTLAFFYASGEGRWGYTSIDGGSQVMHWFPSTGSFDAIGTLTYTVYLSAGLHTLTISNPSGWAPDFDRISTHDYEAEHHEIVGGAVSAYCSECSGFGKVGWVGYTGQVRAWVFAPTAGPHLITIHYTSGEQRTAYVKGPEPGNPYTFPSTGGWNSVGTLSLTLNLYAGQWNQIQISNPNAYAPDIDKISLDDQEAEAPSSTLTGGAGRYYCPNCSGKTKVQWLGFDSTLEVRDIIAPATGVYPLVVFYLSAEQRTAYISVNGGQSVVATFPGLSSWDTVGSLVVPVTLNAGSNSIKFFNWVDVMPDIDRIKNWLRQRTDTRDRQCETNVHSFIGHSREDELAPEEAAAGVSFQGVSAWVPIRDAFLCEDPPSLNHSTVSTMVLSDTGPNRGWVQAGYEWQNPAFQANVKKLCRFVAYARDQTQISDPVGFQHHEDCQPDWSPALNSEHNMLVRYIEADSRMEACAALFCRVVPWDPAALRPFGWGRPAPLSTWMPRAFGETNYKESDIPGTYDNTVRFSDFRFQLPGGSNWTVNFGRTYWFNENLDEWSFTDIGFEKNYVRCPANGVDDRCFHMWVDRPRV